MASRKTCALAAALLVMGAGVSAAADVRWGVYYADRATMQEYSRFKLLVLDSDHHAPLAPLAKDGKTVLGYLSVGEVGSHRPYFAAVQHDGLLLQENENWKGSFFVDVRDRRWTTLIVDQLVPRILSQGFAGVFLDTLDNPGHLERTDPQKYRGSVSAAADLVKAIRRRYPAIKIMMNRAYELLPQVEALIDYELGESVFTDYDFRNKRYGYVPRAQYQEQVQLLTAARRRRPDLQVVTLDYWNPADQDGIARIYDEQRKNGFSPYVATIALDQFVAEPVPASDSPIARTILALYDSRYDQDTRRVPIHQIAEMPLNHLGLVVRYHDVNTPLPPLTEMRDVRGILTWFRDDSMLNPAGFLAWADAVLDAGKKVVVIGDVSATFDLKKRRTPAAAITEFWSRLGLRSDGEWKTITYDLKIVHRDPVMVGFERPFSGVLPAFPRMTKVDRLVKSYLVIRRGSDPATDSELLAIGPHGGYVAPGYLHFSRTDDAPHRQWYVNPFEFFREAYGTDDLPKPDASTISGRRIFYSHVDGDGWRNLTEIPRYRARKALASEVILEEVVKAFPDFPVTIAPIAGDLDRAWHGTRESLRVARAMFALPNVEAGTHTYSHPIDWKAAEAAPGAASNLGIVARALAWARSLYGSPLQAAGDVRVDRPTDVVLAGHEKRADSRTYDVRPFSLDLEVRGSTSFINTLLPPGKHVTILQWSGDTSPSAATIAATRAAGLRNLNGGDTRFDPEFNSYAWVSPLGKQVGDERQIYASNSNENMYTQLWTDRFYAFKYLAETLKNTESPMRVKPENVYFHMYSGEKLPSLLAVVENYRYARGQELAPVAASTYAAIVDGFFSVRIVKIGDRQWRVENRDALQTLRFDRSAHLSVDFSKSTGVVGQRAYQGSLYVALDAADPHPIVALGDTPARGPYLSHSRWQISHLQTRTDGFLFSTHGFGPGESVWKVAPNARFAVRVTSHGDTIVQHARADQEGTLRLKVAEGGRDPVQVSVMLEDGA